MIASNTHLMTKVYYKSHLLLYNINSVLLQMTLLINKLIVIPFSFNKLTRRVMECLNFYKIYFTSGYIHTYNIVHNNVYTDRQIDINFQFKRINNYKFNNLSLDPFSEFKSLDISVIIIFFSLPYSFSIAENENSFSSRCALWIEGTIDTNNCELYISNTGY